MNRMFPYPEPYVRFLAEFHGSRDFFECHEIMEAHWKSQRGARHEGCWLVLIRISVACYHARRGNWAGALKLGSKAIDEIDPALMDELGLDGVRLAERLRQTVREWEDDGSKTCRELELLPIADPELLRESQAFCRREGWSWGTPPGEVPVDVVNRHLTRDRTAVVETRRLAAERKRAGRE